MALTDQQLRQELISYGEAVPPITQRNREQLRARLELLRSQTRTRTPASPTRSHVAAPSPSKSQATASPSRTQATASPSRTQTATASPSRLTRTTASPSRPPITASPTRAAVAASPSRTRSSTTNTTVASRASTRSKQATNLIELSDSETDAASTGALISRATRSGQTTPNIQTRSTGSRRQQDSPSKSSSSTTLSEISAPPNITNDVEQSIARHRREIKQLLDSARDRNRATNTSISNSAEPVGTPLRPGTKARTDQPSETSNHKNEIVQQSPKPVKQRMKLSSCCSCVGDKLKSFWKKNGDVLKNLLKIILITSILTGTTMFLGKNYQHLLPIGREINCSVKNATVCEDMAAVIATVQKQLQVRTGEVQCNYRPKSDLFIKRAEIEKYLNQKGLKFNLGDEERWNTLVTYILNKPLKDILTWDDKNVQTKDVSKVKALSTEQASRSILCRIQQDIDSTTKTVLSFVLGFTGLVMLALRLRKQSGTQEDNEEHFKNLLGKVTKSLEEQYEKHLHDPKTQPWLVISQIHETFISEKDEKKLKSIWERVKNHINNDKSQVAAEIQQVNGEDVDVWRWTKSSPMKTRSQTAKKSTEESNTFVTSDIGLTECLKLRNCFRSDNYTDEKEIDQVTKAIRNRCETIKQIEHIGIHSIFVYVKFSSKEAAGQAYDLLNNWNYQGRTINVKYIRHSRYNEHFPEARSASPKK